MRAHFVVQYKIKKSKKKKRKKIKKKEGKIEKREILFIFYALVSFQGHFMLFS